MFDIGFSELVVIGLVALIVIGPERLPRVARTIGHLVGRLQRYVTDVKADINREIEIEELRKMRDSMQKAASDFESAASSELAKAETDLNRSVADAAGGASESAPIPASTGSEAPAEAGVAVAAESQPAAQPPAQAPAESAVESPAAAPAVKPFPGSH
jgi:sec-independent protein translocase protein TatB